MDIGPLPPDRFREVLSYEGAEQLDWAVESGIELFRDRVLWNVNSTARGGGVAEMLRSLVAYARGGGVDCRWVVIEGSPEFFEVTKRIHNRLHGAAGDGGSLSSAEQSVYRGVCARNAAEFSKLVRTGDVVLLHDPQTGGMAAPLKAAGAHVVWRCHVGLDTPNDLAREAWGFLLPHVAPADSYVFSREAFVWDSLEPAKLAIIPPSIDAFSPKNQRLTPSQVTAILATAQLQDAPGGGAPVFQRIDGSRGRVDREAQMIEDAPLPGNVRMVAQVSRWDRLKDPLGVIDAFAAEVAPRTHAHLLLAGPDVLAVADDPEGPRVLAEVTERRETLPSDVRGRVHLARLPMEDGDENAAIVNALQRRADVIVQKSLAEGFGLTVAEGMWKGRPVVASRVGGIQDQIVDGESGVLVDPADLAGCGRAVADLLSHPQRASAMGDAAMERVRTAFLGSRHLTQYVQLFERLAGAEAHG